MRLPRYIVLLFAFILPAVHAAILAIDYGAEFTKLSLVKQGMPFDILLDRDSKRKISSVVGWKRDDRVFGAEGKMSATRFPQTHFPYVKPLIGMTEAPELDIYPNPPVRTENGGLAFPHFKQPAHFNPQLGVEAEAWTPTALLAHQLSYFKSLADEAAEEPVNQAVVTIPAWWTQQQRKTYREALELQGIHCLAMIGEGTGIGINFAMTRTFPSYNPETGEGEKEYHLVFDSGAQATSATVLAFYQTSWSPSAKSKMVINTTHVDSLGVGWEDIGGLNLDLAMRDLLVDEFVAKSGKSKKEVTNDKRAMAKLAKEATRVKHILSVNKESLTSIEGVMDDIDFRSSVSRQALEDKFESQLADFTKPIAQALKSANLKLDDISSVIMFGGNTRVPFIQAALRDALGPDKLIAQNVNADESAVLGAAFYAAALSRQFKMKSFEIAEHSVYDFSLGDEVVFPAGTLLGERKALMLDPKNEIELQFKQGETPITDVTITNVDAALANFTGSEPKVNVTMRLDARGIFGIANVQLVATGKEEGSGVAGAIKGLFGGKKDDGEKTEDGEGAEDKAEEPVAEENATAPVVKKPKTTRVALKFKEKALGSTLLTKEEKGATSHRLRSIATYEAAMRAREEARNMLEGYLYKIQNIFENEDGHLALHEFSTKAERKAILALATETLDWLHENAEDAGVATLISKRTAIETLEEPIVKRFTEHEGRSQAVVNYRKALYAGRAFVDEGRQNVTEALEAAKNASPDEPVAPPKYTMAELQVIEDMLIEGGEWLDGLMTEQVKLNDDKTADPVIFIKDLDDRGTKLQAAVQRLEMRKPPRAPRVKPSASSSSSSTTSTAPADAETEPAKGGAEEDKPVHDEL